MVSESEYVIGIRKILRPYCIVRIQDWVGEEFTERPDVEEAYILQWEAADVVIPWPKGRTPKQAILDWAVKTMFPDDDTT